MNTVGIALLRSQWSKSRLSLMGMLGIITVWIALLASLLIGRFATPQAARDIFHTSILIEALSAVIWMVFLQVDLGKARTGFPRRLYTLPASTARLVFWSMLYGLIAMAALHLAVTLIFRALVGTSPPLLEPIVFMGALYCWSSAVVWGLPDFTVLRLLLIVLPGTPLGMWLMARYDPNELRYFDTLWPAPAPGALLWLAASIPISYAAAAAGVARDRRGEAQGMPGLKALWGALLGRLPERRKGFASREAAQFWMEWRRKGWILPGIMLALHLALPLCFIIFGFAYGWPKVDELFETLFGFAFLAPLFGGFPVGALLGRYTDKVAPDDPWQQEMDLFRAVRPLSDRAMAAVIYKVGAASMLLTWAISYAALAAYSAAFALAGRGEEVGEAWMHFIWDFSRNGDLLTIPILTAMAMLGGWTLMSVVATMAMAGRPRVFMVVLIAFLALFVGIPISRIWLGEEHWKALIQAFPVVLGAVFALAAPVGAVMSRRQGVIGAGWLWSALGLWLVALVAGVGLVGMTQESLAKGVLITGALCLSVAPLGLGPLAIHWNRHR